MIYCAGALFTESERNEMLQIATVLEANGHDVFLPHRDGIDGGGRINGENFPIALQKEIFALDTKKIKECECLVLNMNGRVPDEGAMVEAGIAWALGKKVVIYKNDYRSLMCGADNPLVIGLSNFTIISNINDIPSAI